MHGDHRRCQAEKPLIVLSQFPRASSLSHRNAIELMFCRLKDFRRVATKNDRNAANFLAAVCIAATVSYWLDAGRLG